MKKLRTLPIVGMVVFLALQTPAAFAKRNIFGIDVTVGATEFDASNNSGISLVVTPRMLLSESRNRSLQLVMPLATIEGFHGGSWSNPCMDFRWCPSDLLFFLLDPNSDGISLNPADLDMGPTFVLTPGLEWTFRKRCPTSPSFFVGGGVWHDTGDRTHEFSTGDVTSPTLTLGGAINRRFSRYGRFRLEAKAFVVFRDDMEVTIRTPLPDGSPGTETITFDGATRVALSLNAGWSFRF